MPQLDREVLAPFGRMLRRYLMTLGARGAEVDDLVQEVFVFALQHTIEDRGVGPVGRFLRGVAKNLLLRGRRTAAARREVEIADEVWDADCADGTGDLRADALRSCIEALPPRGRALLERTYVDGVGRRGSGGEFGLVADGVKTALRRLRAALRTCVERRLGGAP